MSRLCPIHKRNEPHAIYRVWGHDDELLYIGCSMSPLNRVMVHTQRKPWATQIKSVSIEWLPNWRAAIKAERDAIIAEAPIWNSKHNIQSLADAKPSLVNA